MKKEFLAGLVIVVISIGLVVVNQMYINKPIQHTPESKLSHLNTYFNTELGFEFQYPKEFELQTFTAEKNGFKGIMLKKVNNQSKEIWMYLPSVLDPAANPQAKQISDYESNYHTNFYESKFKDSPKKNYAEVIITNQTIQFVNNYKIVRQIYDLGIWQNNIFDTTSESFENGSLRYIISNGSKVYILKSIDVTPNEIKELDALYNGIITTFKIY